MDGEVEVEFPCFNQLQPEQDTWAPNPSYTGGHFGGVVLQTSASAAHILEVMFTRVQIQLRRNTLRRYRIVYKTLRFRKGRRVNVSPLFLKNVNKS